MGNLACSNAYNNVVQGDHNSKLFKYVKVSLKKCKGGKKNGCKRTKDVDDFFKKNQMKIVYKDMYTDVDDSRSPVKYYINDNFITGIDERKTKMLNLFLQNGTLRQSFLIKSYEEPIFSVGKMREFTTPRDDSDADYFVAYIREEPVKLTV